MAKNFFLSIHRTSQAIKTKSAATKITFAATFCSIIIKPAIIPHQLPQKSRVITNHLQRKCKKSHKFTEFFVTFCYIYIYGYIQKHYKL